MLREYEKHYKYSLIVVIAVCLTWTAYTVSQGPFALKRSIPGRVVRQALGKSVMVEQNVEDLADELSQPAAVTALRSWASVVLAVQHNREVQVDSILYPGFFPCIAAPEIPPPPALAWYKAMIVCLPQTYLLVNTSRRIIGVILGWGGMRVGVVVVPGGIVPNSQGISNVHRIAPDIQIFSAD